MQQRVVNVLWGFYSCLKYSYIIPDNPSFTPGYDNNVVKEVKETKNNCILMESALSEEVADKMKALLMEYNAKEAKTFDDILDFLLLFALCMTK